jgi:hypothetical protein
MKKVLKTLAAASVASISVEIGAVAADNFQRLSGNQIGAKFSGMQLTDEVHWRDSITRASSGEPQRTVICQRRLCGGDRNHSRRMHPAGTHRYWRLADRHGRAGLARHPVSMESQQPAPDRRDRGRGPDRVPAAATDLGHGPIDEAEPIGAISTYRWRST